MTEPISSTSDLDLAELQREWALAEEAVREAQEIGGAVSLPPINEMRFAGHHLLAAVSTADEVRRSENLRLAVGHCRRARTDAQRGAVVALSLEAGRVEARGSQLPAELVAELASLRRSLEDQEGSQTEGLLTETGQSVRLMAVHAELLHAASSARRVSRVSGIAAGLAGLGAVASLVPAVLSSGLSDRLSALVSASPTAVTVVAGAVLAVVSSALFDLAKKRL